jgi:hypothetical protein
MGLKPLLLAMVVVALMILVTDQIIIFLRAGFIGYDHVMLPNLLRACSEGRLWLWILFWACIKYDSHIFGFMMR